MRIFSSASFQQDVLTDEAAQHFLHVLNHVVEADDFRLHHLLAAEREELPSERRGALSGLRNLLHAIAPRIVWTERVQDNFVVAGDDGEQVVEIVRHAARKFSERIHFLGLEKLHFDFLARGNVLREADDAVDRALLVADGKCAVANPSRAPVGADDAVGLVVFSLGLQRKCGLHGVAILGVDRLHE